MFTGIVTAKGRLESATGTGDRRFTVASSYPVETIDLGASICHAGVCLTVVSKQATASGSVFEVEVSPETLARTTLGAWQLGEEINLEKSLRLGDEMGGHLVTGHVDGVGEIVDREDNGDWLSFRVKAPEQLSRFIAEKGSIAVDGVSLTVNSVAEDRFELMIIPHTAEVTTLGSLQIGARVNLEVDLMARYAARLMQVDR
ncbi:riboflavin synthase [Hyphobacterium sp. HN65]|uniref:Riboflavin synthase n=1 Tax=Hyphobacterium lacteum TaxID=3116575 RepID=A0ABU7LM61_9PROT|nr:riboflavin synthase [Hyphobacterium sp. HN65]MEE2525023.1 riboflavin synthase [Hyphobacterium sp. HN65]